MGEPGLPVTPASNHAHLRPAPSTPPLSPRDSVLRVCSLIILQMVGTEAVQPGTLGPGGLQQASVSKDAMVPSSSQRRSVPSCGQSSLLTHPPAEAHRADPRLDYYNTVAVKTACRFPWEREWSFLQEKRSGMHFAGLFGRCASWFWFWFFN